MRDDILRISVPVRAVPGGNSKRAFVSPKTGRAFVVDKTRGKDQFIATVRQFAAAAASDTGWEIADGPVELGVMFELARPSGHYGTGKNACRIKPSFVNAKPTVKPDLTNIVKRVEDALTGIVWLDDRQVVETRASKDWSKTDLISIIVVKSASGPNFAQDESRSAERQNYHTKPRKTRQRKASGLSGKVKAEPVDEQATFLEGDE